MNEYNPQIKKLESEKTELLKALEELLQSSIQSEHIEHNNYNGPAEIDEMMANGDFSISIYNAIAIIAKAKGQQ